MNTMIDSRRPEIAPPTANQAETRSESEPREQLIGWLIVLASTILMFLVCKIVMLELEVHYLLEQLQAVMGQSTSTKS